MDQSIELLTSNPVYMAVAVVLALLILVGVIKKLIKFVLVVSALLVLWVAYMVWSGEDVTVESLKEGFQSGIENIKEKTTESAEKAKETINKSIEEKTEEKLDQILPKRFISLSDFRFHAGSGPQNRKIPPARSACRGLFRIKSSGSLNKMNSLRTTGIRRIHFSSGASH